jgi:hypothetical protein
MGICDFCSSPLVTKRFACVDFDSASQDAGIVYPDPTAAETGMNLVLASKGYWAACAPCAALVQAQDLDGLVKRALDELEKPKKYPKQFRANVEMHLHHTYQLFFKNKTGEFV